MARLYQIVFVTSLMLLHLASLAKSDATLSTSPSPPSAFDGQSTSSNNTALEPFIANLTNTSNTTSTTSANLFAKRGKSKKCIPFVKYKKGNANCGLHVRQWQQPPYKMEVKVKGSDAMCYETITKAEGQLIRNCYYTPWAVRAAELPRGGHVVIEKRIMYDEPENQELKFTYGGDVWYSHGPRCKVGKWDPNRKRDMDCRFACGGGGG